jgi:flagellar hook assembly protein FlgD
MLGQKVMTLVNEVHNAGQYRVTWSGNDNFGNKVASGVYFYKLRAGSFESVKRMMLLK